MLHVETLHSYSQCEAAKQDGNHSANYRGCPVYKELLKRLNDKQTAKSAPPVFTIHKENFTKINNVKSNEKSSVSYAVKTWSGLKHVFKH